MATVWGTVVQNAKSARADSSSGHSTEDKSRTKSDADPAATLPNLLDSTYDSDLPVCNYFKTSITTFIGRCLETTNQPTTTPDTTTDTTPGATYNQARNLATNLIAKLDIPDPQLHIGPDPTLNEWNMAIIGIPYWLWTTEPATKTTTVTIANHTITLTAHRDSTTFNPGDNTTPITCTTTTPRTDDQPMTPSPTCGHTYTQRNEPGTNYPLTAQAHWTIDWTALGHTGTLHLRTTTTRNIHVGELQSIIIANKTKRP